MTDLEPTPERIAAALAACGRDWTMGTEGTIEVTTNPVLGEMVTAGLIAPHFVTPFAQVNGQDDYYRLTYEGHEWLTRHDVGNQQ